MDVRNIENNSDLSQQENRKIRILNLKKQTILSFIFQGISVAISFLVIRISINFLNTELYGIWITLLSMLSWITMMDLGIGLGLRNKLSQVFAVNDLKSAKAYVTTAYIGLGSLLIIILIIFLFIIQILPWNTVFNTFILPNKQFSTIVTLTTIGIFCTFLLGLINQILNALQKSAFVVCHPIFLNLIFILILHISTSHKNDLQYVCLAYIGASLFSFSFITICVFYKYPYLIPNIKYYDNKKIKQILFLGVEFFVIQIAVVIIFNTDNLIITQILGPKEVTGYQLTRQIFGSLSMLATLVMSPLWSAYTEAYARKDLRWIRTQIKRTILLMIPLIIGILMIIFNFQAIMTFWIKKNSNISVLLVICMGIYTIVSIWNNIFASFLNGISKTREQLYTAIFACIINVPLSIYLAKNLGLGSAGVIIGTTLSLSVFAIVGPYVTYSLLRRK